MGSYTSEKEVTGISVTNFRPENTLKFGLKMKEVSHRFAEQNVSTDISPLEARLLHRTFTT
jgi:hypothetical protein